MNLETVKFLIVEDDDDHAKIIERSLTRNRPNNDVHRVADGLAALNYLRANPPYEDRVRPDVVLLDLNLPKLGGHDVLEQIKSDESLRSIPIVVLTTSDSEGDRELAYLHFANSYLVKPMNFSQFRILVDELSQYWGEFNRPPQSTH